MTVLDVLRYPISDRPTREEIAALPHELFMDWANTVGWPEWKTIDIVANHYGLVKYSRTPHSDVKTLRRMIKEYEPI